MLKKLIDKLKDLVNPLKWVEMLVKPSQFSSAARTLLKVVAGFLLAQGFSPEVVDQFLVGAEPIVTGLMALVIGAIASFVSQAKQAKE